MLCILMSGAICTKCQGTGRLLEGPSREAWVEYYACDACGHVWMRANADAAAVDIVLPKPTFRVVEPWGPNKGRQNTVYSEHATIREAFDALDRCAVEMVRTEGPSDPIELVVVDEHGQVVPRPGTH